MPFAFLAYERVTKEYKSVIEDIHKKKSEKLDMYIKEVLFRTEIARRDFTKRQLKILGMIFNFSFLYGKEWALIPMMKDFELVGISKVKIRSEIDYLVDINIIEWNQEENLFRIRAPKEWKAPYNNGYNDNRMLELYLLNIKHESLL